MPTAKGHKKAGGAPKGNRNHAQGPRIGRKDRQASTKVAAVALPQPAEGAKLPSQHTAGRDKTGGRDFQPGQNSHNGETFQRGADMIPRGNITLFWRIVYNDRRERLMRRCEEIIDKGTNREVIALAELITNRVEGLPVKKVEVAQRQRSTFITPDGQDAMPPRELVGSGATPAAASAEDRLIMGEVSV